MFNSTPKRYFFLYYIAMTFLLADLASLVLTYKFIKIGPIFISAEAFIFPLTYTCADIIAEVYGYTEARKMIFIIFIFDFIFSLIMFICVKLPSPNENMQHMYLYVFGSLLRGTLAETAGVLAGGIVNIYAISKLKILTHGKHFWLRSITSSTIGEAVLVIISMPILFLGTVSHNNLYSIIIFTYLYKIFFAIIIAWPATIITNILKSKEYIYTNDNNSPLEYAINKPITI